jgi:hypothetical protein
MAHATSPRGPRAGARRGVPDCRAGRNDPIGRGPGRHRAAGGWRTAGRGRRMPGPDRPAAGSRHRHQRHAKENRRRMAGGSRVADRGRRIRCRSCRSAARGARTPRPPPPACPTPASTARTAGGTVHDRATAGSALHRSAVTVISRVIALPPAARAAARPRTERRLSAADSCCTRCQRV